MYRVAFLALFLASCQEPPKPADEGLCESYGSVARIFQYTRVQNKTFTDDDILRMTIRAIDRDLPDPKENAIVVEIVETIHENISYSIYDGKYMSPSDVGALVKQNCMENPDLY